MNNESWNLYKKSPKYPAETPHSVLFASTETHEECLDTAMSDIYAELHDGDGENGGMGSLWRCAKEIYDSLANGHHYQYADCEWWIEKIPREQMTRKWQFYYVAGLEKCIVIEDVTIEKARARAKDAIMQSAHQLREYIGNDLLGWKFVDVIDGEGNSVGLPPVDKA